jgi:hypothetical protein
MAMLKENSGSWLTNGIRCHASNELLNISTSDIICHTKHFTRVICPSCAKEYDLVVAFVSDITDFKDVGGYQSSTLRDREVFASRLGRLGDEILIEFFETGAWSDFDIELFGSEYDEWGDEILEGEMGIVVDGRHRHTQPEIGISFGDVMHIISLIREANPDARITANYLELIRNVNEIPRVPSIKFRKFLEQNLILDIKASDLNGL